MLQLPLALGAGAIWYASGGAVWFAGEPTAAWPALLLLAMWPLHWLANRARPRPTATDLFLALFLISAGVSVWAAYNRGPAWAKFSLIVGAAGIYYAFAHQRDPGARRIAVALLGLLGAGLAAYFFATHDWEANPTKVRALSALGQSVAGLAPQIDGHSITPNVAGGILAMLFPYYVPLLAWTKAENPGRSRGKWAVVGRALWVLCGSAVTLGLLVTASRGAWLSTCGAMALWMLWRALGHWFTRKMGSQPAALRMRGLICGLALLSAGVLAVLGGTVILRQGWPGAAALAGRLELLRDGLLLARDYPLTGIGLGMFEMQYAIYTLLLHVGYIVNSHNLFLDVAIEQGLIGLGLLLGLVWAALRGGLRALHQTVDGETWLVEAALASMMIALSHGLVDDVLYGSRGVLLLFVPLGVLAAAVSAESVHRPHSTGTHKATGAGALDRGRWAWAAFAGGLVLGMLLLRPALTGAWYANLGALAQSRVELNVYDQAHFGDPTVDQVRAQENLDAAVAHFERAVAIAPGNATARQRLASIALARGAYPTALEHMEAAWARGQRDSVTRLLYGDALVAAGEPEQAAQVVRGLKWARPRLEGQAWARYTLGDDLLRTYYAWQTISLLDPKDVDAQRKVADIENSITTK